MDEAQLVDRFYGQDNLGDVKPSYILREDFVLDEHSHQVTTGQELHQHIQEVCILKCCEELDDPRAVRLGKDVSLGAHVRELVLLEHFCLDEGLHGVDDAIRLLLDKLDLSERALSDDLDGRVILGLVLCPQEAQVPSLLFAAVLP